MRDPIHTQQYLWSPVVECYYLVSVQPTGNSKSSGQTKICQFDDPVPGDEKIGWLEVSVHDSSLVAVCNALIIMV